MNNPFIEFDVSDDACFEIDINFVGNDINADQSDKDYGSGAGIRNSVRECQELCQSRAECNVFTYKTVSKACWLKRNEPMKLFQSGVISGPKFCGNCIQYLIHSSIAKCRIREMIRTKECHLKHFRLK